MGDAVVPPPELLIVGLARRGAFAAMDWVFVWPFAAAFAAKPTAVASATARSRCPPDVLAQLQIVPALEGNQLLGEPGREELVVFPFGSGFIADGRNGLVFTCEHACCAPGSQLLS